jgi:hypothetical protein
MDNTLTAVANLGANDPTANMPDEIKQLLAELPSWIQQRNDAMGGIKRAYDEDPRLKETPFQAKVRGMFNNDAPTNAAYSVARGSEAEQAQKEWLFKHKLGREEAVLKNLDLDTFDKMYSAVAKNVAKNAAKKDYKGDFKVIGDAGVAWNPNTQTVEEVYRNERNSPLYGKLYDSFLAQSLKPELRFENDEQRLAWVIQKTEAAMKAAKATDKTRIGSPDPYPTDGGFHRPGMDPNVLPKPVQFSFTPDQLAKFKDPAYLAHVKKAMLPEEAAQFDTWLKEQAPTLAQQLAPVASAAKEQVARTTGGPQLMTPEVLKMKGTQYENYAKEHAADKDALKSSLSMIPSMSVMKSILSNKDMRFMSGPLHEQLVAGAGYLNYLDPDSKFVKAGNDVPTYFSNMMNLVRDKIQALGSGTAVSNLDLIVTQKSVGDLRNNPEGNKKLLAIMDLQNATLNERLGKKINYFESGGKGYEGYDKIAITGASEPTHIVRRDQNTGNYYVQNKDEWIKEWSTKKRMSPEEIAKYWKSEANDATAKLVEGTSIKFGGR